MNFCEIGKTGKLMLKEERQAYLLTELWRLGKITALAMSEGLAVSEDTIRRDLRELAAAGKLQRVHGGAVLRSPATGTFTERTRQTPAAKVKIAAAAAAFVQDGQVVLLDGGTTNLEVAKQLPQTLAATVVTPSPAVALALLDYPRVEVILLGGALSKTSGATQGLATADALRYLRVDLCILGVCSLHPEVGITVQESEEAHLKRLMIAQAADVMAVAVADKLGTALPYIVGPISTLTHLVTEHFVTDAVLADYRAQSIVVVQR
jgi:DeoR/GlpR family transcriptional regulator of sugar metabolism